MAASAGNHAQGVALAASLTGLRSTIFMPAHAPLPKVEATRSYGAAVRLEGDAVDDCLVAAKAYAEATGAIFVPPFDHPIVIAGQGTIGLEIADEATDLETVVVPIGGGGLIAGVATALAHTVGPFGSSGSRPRAPPRCARRSTRVVASRSTRCRRWPTESPCGRYANSHWPTCRPTSTTS